MKVSLSNIVYFAIFAFIIGMVANFYLHKPKAEAPLEQVSATILTQARPVADFNLIDHDNELFSNADLQGQWSFLFFGFTHCPDICPTTMSELAQVFKQQQASDAQVVLVTIDPQRDNPEQLKDYVQSFNENFMGVTGTDEQLTSLQQQFGIVVDHREHMAHMDHGDMDHSMHANHQAKQVDIDHSGSIILINPQGEYQALFTMPHDAESIASDFTRIKNHYQAQQLG